jgi:hypothetical protein
LDSLVLTDSRRLPLVQVLDFEAFHPRKAAFTASPLFTAMHAAPLLGFGSSRLSTSAIEPGLPRFSALDVRLGAPSLSRSRIEVVLSVSLARGPASRLRFARLLELSILLSDPPCPRSEFTARCLALTRLGR